MLGMGMGELVLLASLREQMDTAADLAEVRQQLAELREPLAEIRSADPRRVVREAFRDTSGPRSRS